MILWQHHKGRRMARFINRACLLFCLLPMWSAATDQYVTIGTNTFGFAFEDTSLTTNMQARIIDDWKVMTEPWRYRSVKISLPTAQKTGSLFFSGVTGRPDFKEKIAAKSYALEISQSTNIVISRKLSDSYKSTFQLENTYSNEINKISELVRALQYENIILISSNQISNIYYYHKMETNHYELVAEQIKSQFTNLNVFLPSKLSFDVMPEGFITHPEEALWVLIPIQYKTGYFDNITYMPAIFIDGKWKIHPLIFW